MGSMMNRFARFLGRGVFVRRMPSIDARRDERDRNMETSRFSDCQPAAF